MEGSGELTIGEMSTGMSSTGMQEYLDQIKAEILTDISNQLDTAREEIIKVLKTAWVGQSEERFETLITTAVENVKTDLNAEYNALEARLNELTNNYYNQENALISE